MPTAPSKVCEDRSKQAGTRWCLHCPVGCWARVWGPPWRGCGVGTASHLILDQLCEPSSTTSSHLVPHRIRNHTQVSVWAYPLPDTPEGPGPELQMSTNPDPEKK